MDMEDAVNDESFFTHVVVVGLLIIGLLFLGLTIIILWGLWTAGFKTFVFVAGSFYVFCWIVHKLATSETVKRWLDKL
jgi:hypothetical protein